VAYALVDAVLPVAKDGNGLATHSIAAVAFAWPVAKSVRTVQHCLGLVSKVGQSPRCKADMDVFVFGEIPGGAPPCWRWALTPIVEQRLRTAAGGSVPCFRRHRQFHPWELG
jgi:hypothetical protein